MSKTAPKLKQAGMVSVNHSMFSRILQIFGINDESAQTEQYTISHPQIHNKAKQSKSVAKKSARFIKQSSEEIKEITFSDDNITIHIIPVSAEEQASKKVRGYRYLSA